MRDDVIVEARARRATSDQCGPGQRPSVFSRISSPRKLFLSQTPCFIEGVCRGNLRASASSCAIVSSATLMLLAPGAFMTTMPRALAAATSTLSTPVPARDGAKLRCGRDQIGGDLGGAADDDGVGVSQVGGKPAPDGRCARRHSSLRNGAMWGRRREIVSDDDFHYVYDHTGRRLQRGLGRTEISILAEVTEKTWLT